MSVVIIGNRDDIVRTTSGHIISFATDQEVAVPDDPFVIKACTDRGHVIKKGAPKQKEPVIAPAAKEPIK